MVVRGHHGHEGLSQVVGHQAAQPPATSGQGQKILSRGRVPRCVSTLRAQDDQALRAGGSAAAGKVSRVTQGGRHETHPGTSTVTHSTDRPQPNSTRQPRRKLRPRAAAPRAVRRDEHKSERQRATARNGRPRPPPRQHSSRRKADARRAVIREAKRAESPARPGRKADQESPLRGGGERGGAFWAVQFHRNHAEKCP